MSQGETNSKVEFSVNLTCQSCVDKTNSALRSVGGISNFNVNLEQQKVVVETSLPTIEVQKVLESTGKRAVVVGIGSVSSKSPGLAAVATIGGPMGFTKTGVRGVIRFAQVDDSSCIIDGTLDGLPPNSDHGIAVHECGDLSGGCTSIGPHFNPRGTRHGSPQDAENARHVGDLGNVSTDASGRASVKFTDHVLKVQDIIGRSLAVSEQRDDLGKGGHQSSLVNGNSGDILACGLIARSSGLFQNDKKFCACDGVKIWDERDKPVAGEARKSHL